MHPQHQPVWLRTTCAHAGGGETGSPSRQGLLGCILATAEAIDMVEPTPIRPNDGHLPSTPETNVDRSPRNGKRPRRGTTLPIHRSIVAVDIEGSTQRSNPIKGELREDVYRLTAGALDMAEIDDQYCDPFIDRGDGLLILLRHTDDFPRPFLLSRLMPALASLLIARNSGISPAEKPRIMRLRAVVHAGDVHYDGKGPFGEDLDVAFRLLDAPRFKAFLKTAAGPLALVVSDTIHRSDIRHGYDGIDSREFAPLVNVTVGFQRRKGWVHLPQVSRLSVAVPAQARAAFAS
jgi:hypothetical protein